jgi:septum formation protein
MLVKLILASGSPRRANLLQQIGLTFEVVRPDIDETVEPGESPVGYATRMSASKMLRSRGLLKEAGKAVILCADTIVVLDKEIVGKPETRFDAITVLQRMSGKKHQVLTSVTIGETTSSKQRSFIVETIVTFRRLSVRECEAYWETGEPADKSGSYGIQGLGSIFVAGIDGSPSNVAGLPLMETAAELKSFGIECLVQL